jgi:hypothetical protein
MLKIYLFTLILLGYNHSINAKPNKPNKSCCLEHKNKPDNPLEIANYDCSILTSFGDERCNQVYGGNVCKWGYGNSCNSKKCNRLSKYELHYGKYIDVGYCDGECKDDTDSCNPLKYSNMQIGESSIKVIKECTCESCGTVPLYTNVEIGVDKCKGDCNVQKNNICSSGVNDNFSSSNGIEPSQPSLSMISGILSGCSAGIQSGFDIFVDNRCFGHTFTNCFSQGECPLKSANLKICMRAANVFLTNTDSLVLGINGGGLWGIGLPTLNGGTWNQNEQLCLDLNLENLPGTGANILLDIQMSGHLDVMVQDDTAVDFLELSIQYEKCQKCIPSLSSMSHLYSNGKTTDYLSSDDCDCVDINECKRYDHFVTYYEGTMYETNINIGQCLGKCSNYLRCNSVYGKKMIKSPEGSRTIQTIEKCECGKLTWNPNGLYLDKK